MSDTVVINEKKSSEIEKYKKNLITYGILTGVFAVMFGLIVLFALTSRASWREGLKLTVQEVLEENGYTYVVQDPVYINSTISYSCQAYTVKPIDYNNQNMYAIVLRMATLYGPQAAVFVFNQRTENAEFIGFAKVSGRANTSIVNNSLLSQIEYWQGRIPSIMKSVSLKKDS